MARKVFFSFHYDDVSTFRANVVRNAWLLKKDRKTAGFFDSSIWESAKKTSSLALKRLINKGLLNTSVTAVLIGTNTYKRPWVRYEIFKSLKKGNGIIGIHVNGIKGKDGKTKTLGKNPFDYLAIKYSDDGKKITMLEWKVNKWVEYSEIDGSASYSIKQTSKSKWGKQYQLSKFYKTKKWNADKGYNNFGGWIEKIAK